MKIQRIETRIAGVPGRNWVFVLVHTHEGPTGIGEATCEWHETAVLAAVAATAERLVGEDATRIEHIWQRLYRQHHFRGGVVMSTVLSAVDQALWDIAGKISGLPVYRLLGGAVRDYVQLYARPDADGVPPVEQARQAAAAGIPVFKFGIAARRASERELERALTELVRDMRQATGTNMELWLDHAGRSGPAAAIRLMHSLRAAGLDVLEEPVPPDSPNALRAIRSAVPPGLELATGERFATRWQFAPLILDGLVDVVQPDVCHCGGISELRRIAALAELRNIPIAPHCPRGPVGLAASCHVALATPNFRVLEHCRRYPQFFDVQTDPWPIPANGRVTVPERPGLGVALDEAFFEAHPFAALPCRDWRRSDGAVFEG